MRLDKKSKNCYWNEDPKGIRCDACQTLVYKFVYTHCCGEKKVGVACCLNPQFYYNRLK